MFEAVKTIKTKDGFVLVQFGEIPQLMQFSIGPIHTYMFNGLSGNVELYHVQHEAYRNNDTAFSVVLQTVQEAIDSYCHPISFEALDMECKECIYDAICDALHIENC